MYFLHRYSMASTLLRKQSHTSRRGISRAFEQSMGKLFIADGDMYVRSHRCLFTYLYCRRCRVFSSKVRCSTTSTSSVKNSVAVSNFHNPTNAVTSCPFRQSPSGSDLPSDPLHQDHRRIARRDQGSSGTCDQRTQHQGCHSRDSRLPACLR